MVMIIKGLVLLFLIGILASCVVCVVWFLWALMVNFYKVYLKSSKVNQDQCNHPSSHYTDTHPDLCWTCHACGKIHS